MRYGLRALIDLWEITLKTVRITLIFCWNQTYLKMYDMAAIFQRVCRRSDINLELNFM